MWDQPSRAKQQKGQYTPCCLDTGNLYLRVYTEIFSAYFAEITDRIISTRPSNEMSILVWCEDGLTEIRTCGGYTCNSIQLKTLGLA